MTVTGADGTGRLPSHDWVSPTQAAARLATAVRDVYRLIDAGKLPAYRIADEIRLLAHEVDAFAGRSSQR